MPQHLEIPDSGGSSIKRKRKGQHVSISGNTNLIDGMDGELCSELRAIETPAVDLEQAALAARRDPAVGRRQQKRTRKVANVMLRLASRYLP